tara:strand:+ start:454 stop:663 length:210 start_codon:yes stop_codon:yes gene_type:complete
MKSNNEITITINVSDTLLSTFANILLIANAPMPPAMGAAIPPELMAQLRGKTEGQPTPRPIGFATKEKE